MAEELKALIDRINEEAVSAAEAKARAIEDEARRKAEAIVNRARAEAQKILSEAGDGISKMKANQKAELVQAARDIIISLKKEINAMLGSLVASHVHKALDTEEMARVITALVKDGAAKHHKEEIVVSLKKEDLEKAEKMLLDELKSATMKGVTLKASGDIKGGFIISYDSGKSYYDFSDKAIAEYITQYIRPKLADILNEAAGPSGKNP